MSRKFEVISKYSFSDEIKMPRRSTSKSAGYDIYNNTGYDIILEPGQLSDPITTYLKCRMADDNVLLILPRSGHGFKYSVRLANTVGVIDADYYNNENNEGEIFLKLHNQGEKTLVIKPQEAMCQGIFVSYLTTEDDEDTVGGTRMGGIGSTNE
jgi:dUTP pyrophosphatase